MADKDQTLTAEVNHDLCAGVGMCVLYAPDAFDFDDAAQAVFLEHGDFTDQGLQEAADACPMAAIKLSAKEKRP